MANTGALASGISGFTSGILAGSELRNRRERLGIQKQESGLRSAREARQSKQFDQTMEFQKARESRLSQNAELQGRIFEQNMKASKDEKKRALNESILGGLGGMMDPDAGFGDGDVPVDIILNDTDFKESVIGKGATNISFEDGDLVIDYGDKKQGRFSRSDINGMRGFFIPRDKRSSLTEGQLIEFGFKGREEKRDIASEEREIEERLSKQDTGVAETARQTLADIKAEAKDLRASLKQFVVGTGDKARAVPGSEGQSEQINTRLNELETERKDAQQKLTDIRDILRTEGPGQLKTGLAAIRQRKLREEIRREEVEADPDFIKATDTELPLEQRKEAVTRLGQTFPSQKATGLLSVIPSPSPNRTRPQEDPTRAPKPRQKIGKDEGTIQAFMRKHPGRTREQIIQAIERTNTSVTPGQ